MSLIKKLKRITVGRIEAFLDSLEDPAYILPQLQKELAGNLDQAIKAQAKALTAVRAVRRKLDEIDGKLQRYGGLAELALAKGNQELARKIVSAQICAEQDKQSLEGQFQNAENAYLQARAVCMQLRDGLSQLKRKSNELKLRANLSGQIITAQRKIDFTSNSIIDSVASMEEKVIEQELAVEIREELAGMLLDEGELEEFERSAEVDRRLEELKKRMQ